MEELFTRHNTSYSRLEYAIASPNVCFSPEFPRLHTVARTLRMLEWLTQRGAASNARTKFNSNRILNLGRPWNMQMGLLSPLQYTAITTGKSHSQVIRSNKRSPYYDGLSQPLTLQRPQGLHREPVGGRCSGLSRN